VTEPTTSPVISLGRVSIERRVHVHNVFVHMKVFCRNINSEILRYCNAVLSYTTVNYIHFVALITLKCTMHVGRSV
jgi:hypothetical protein